MISFDATTFPWTLRTFIRMKSRRPFQPSRTQDGSGRSIVTPWSLMIWTARTGLV